jgi:hypothetical protein
MRWEEWLTDNFKPKIWTKNCIHAIVPIPSPNVSGKLGKALDSLKNGRETDPPHNVEATSSKGILDWSNRSGTICTTTVFRPGRGVMRKMTVKERGRVLDFPGTRTIRMTDDELNILIGNKIPGKVITIGMYFLTTWPRQSPIKRRREANDKGGKDRTLKRKWIDPVEEPAKRTTQQIEVETILENEEHEEREDWVTKNIDWKDPSAEHMKDKATRSDGLAILYHLWNDRIANKFGELWNSDEYKDPPSSKIKDGSPGWRAALTKPRFDFADPFDRSKLSRMLRTLRTAAAMYWKKSVKKFFETGSINMGSVMPQGSCNHKRSWGSGCGKSGRNFMVGTEKWINYIFLEMATRLPRRDKRGPVAYVWFRASNQQRLSATVWWLQDKSSGEKEVRQSHYEGLRRAYGH